MYVIKPIENSCLGNDKPLKIGFVNIAYLFQDILNINVSGYLEDIKRLGNKGGRRRPLLVELLSKNRTNYILSNRHVFKNTGIAVSEVLEGEQLKYRKKLIQNLISARKNGYRAFIKNNKLIIEGQEYIVSNDTDNNISKLDIGTQPTERDESNTSKILNATPNICPIGTTYPVQRRQNQFFRRK
jgi:hypothetical protein